MKQFFITLSLALLFIANIHAQKNVLTENFRNNLDKDEITRSYITPVKVVWQSDSKENQVKNTEVLLTKFDGQLSTSGAGMCVLRSDDDR